MSIKVLYILLLVGTALVVGAAAAILWRIRRHLRATSDPAARLEGRQDRKATPE